MQLRPPRDPSAQLIIGAVCFLLGTLLLIRTYAAPAAPPDTAMGETSVVATSDAPRAPTVALAVPTAVVADAPTAPPADSYPLPAAPTVYGQAIPIVGSGEQATVLPTVLVVFTPTPADAAAPLQPTAAPLQPTIAAPTALPTRGAIAPTAVLPSVIPAPATATIVAPTVAAITTTALPTAPLPSATATTTAPLPSATPTPSQTPTVSPGGSVPTPSQTPAPSITTTPGVTLYSVTYTVSGTSPRIKIGFLDVKRDPRTGAILYQNDGTPFLVSNSVGTDPPGTPVPLPWTYTIQVGAGTEMELYVDNLSDAGGIQVGTITCKIDAVIPPPNTITETADITNGDDYVDCVLNVP